MLRTNVINKGIKPWDEDPEYANRPKDVQIKFQANREKSNTEKGIEFIFDKPAAVRRRQNNETQTQKQSGAKPPTKTTVQQIPKENPTNKAPTIPSPPSPKIEEAPRPTSGRSGFNRPSYIRKLKKIAQNFDYLSLNGNNHSYKDVVRPLECKREKVLLLEGLGNTNEGYLDKQFPSISLSVGRNYINKNVIWKRAKQFTNRPTFGKYVQPNDIEIGSISCPSFASVLSCLAERESNIKRLIQNQQFSQNGFYYVRLNINSVWRYVNVDDYLPLIQDENGGILSFRDSESQISLSLIEKAYAKAYGGYDVFQKKCQPEHYLRDLTGSRVARYNLNDKQTLQSIQQALQNNWTVIAVPNNGIEGLGLSDKYNLGVTGASAAGLQLRNSWGTIIDRPKINLSKEGIFQLSLQQANRYISYVLIAETDDRYRTTTVQSKHKTGFYSSYNFRIKQTTQAIVSASQWDQRLFPKESSYNYSPFRLIIDRRGVGISQYVAGGFSLNDRNLDVLVTLTPGVYTVYCIGSWNKSHAYDYSVTLYANNQVSFEKNQTVSYPNLISQSLQQYNLKNGKRSAKGHVDEYILYQQATNLILLTNLNVSDKPYDYTQDLSKINFNSLNLLNAPNNKQNFSDKLQDQISSIKEDHNKQRRWSIHLEPKQAYTWVISTSEAYNQNNFKNWGFK